MLSDFFRINLSYGLARNKIGEWMAFNREYLQLGFSNKDFRIDFFPDQEFSDLPVYTKYVGLTEQILFNIAASDGESVRRDSNGKIYQIWLYNDETNPSNQKNKKNNYWDKYWGKLEILSKLARK
ncbi:MAG: hypothetical protein PHG29_12705 [Prolixibacteraceae bacterium]|jgi:hypothetical protein|nr:hypothetical protein [Prolixibacteraceae bacterium]NLO02420.1 hypothetical protein [Bacteroidales bacterium]